MSWECYKRDGLIISIEYSTKQYQNTYSFHVLMEHFLKHFKGSQNKPKMFKGEVIQNLFPKHNGNKLEINNGKISGICKCVEIKRHIST